MENANLVYYYSKQLQFISVIPWNYAWEMGAAAEETLYNSLV